VRYSDYIYQISAWLERNGVRVDLYATKLPCMGMYRRETKQIFINVPDAKAALLTLAHEAGHWLGHLIDEKQEPWRAERQAFVYGWHVLRWFDAPISRGEWLVDCREAWHFFKSRVVRTEHLYKVLEATG
jgi:hypothetical protein